MKRITALLLTTLLLLSLAACTGKDKPALTQETVATHVPDMSIDPDTDCNNLN